MVHFMKLWTLCQKMVALHLDSPTLTHSPLPSVFRLFSCKHVYNSLLFIGLSLKETAMVQNWFKLVLCWYIYNAHSNLGPTCHLAWMLALQTSPPLAKSCITTPRCIQVVPFPMQISFPSYSLSFALILLNGFRFNGPYLLPRWGGPL